MKKIKLTQGKYALVDDKDWEWLSQRKWRVVCYPHTDYAKDVSSVGMHRLILNLEKRDGKEVDHRNGNGLDNRRGNLRICTHSKNMQNRHRLKKGTTCTYQGVSMVTGGWCAQIKKDYKAMWLGTYKTKKEAAQVYDKKALELFGPDAKTNFSKENYNG